jgi:ABC-type nitrate/sulfonate/bicarbonate transport system substrate-binding protein
MIVACGSGDDAPGAEPDPQTEEDSDGEDDSPVELPDLTQVTLGYVSAVDQMGAAIALDLGFYDELNLDVTLAQPFPTGVDALSALEAGEIQFTQVGTPSFGAILGGMDVVYLGNYSGSAVQRGIDETMAVVAHADSGIDPDDLTTVEGTRVGVSVGSINHLYVLGMLNSVELTPDDVELVNLPPPEMPVALETQSVDAISIWDPWPIIALNDVEGAVQVSRGDGFLAYIGYIVALRDFVEENPDIVERFLAARAEADLWVRENPEEAADIVVRWFPGTDPDVALDAMEFNVRQIDPRMSACNYLAAHTNLELLEGLDVIDDIYDVNDHFEVSYIHSVLEQNPELVDDLDPIPAEAEIEDPETYTFDPEEAREACPE